MTLRLTDPSQASHIAEEILKLYPEARVFALHGELGAGKTTLIKGFCQVLGVKDSTSSPSFAIVNEYWSTEHGSVYHFDLFRLRDARELEGIGFTEYVDSDAYCFVEWPELATDLLPPGTVHITMAINGEERILTLV